MSISMPPSVVVLEAVPAVVGHSDKVEVLLKLVVSVVPLPAEVLAVRLWKICLVSKMLATLVFSA